MPCQLDLMQTQSKFVKSTGLKEKEKERKALLPIRPILPLSRTPL